MSEFVPPEEVEEYRVLRPIGRGAMGQVYLAHDTLLDRPVALKFVVGDVEPGVRAQLFVEARAVARLSHPNVVAIHRVGEVRRRPYLVSEFVRGVSLDKVDKPLPWRRALELGVGMSRGLAAAHRRGVLHRDIKPQNVMLTDEGEVKLLDFGLAQLSGDDGKGGAARGSPGGYGVLGTPLYMAPEAWRGEPPTARVDVYALGVLLYELLSGRPPFADATSNAELKEAVCRATAPPLAARAPEVDAQLAAIVDRCLSLDAAARFASGDELRDALEQRAAAARPQAVPAGNPYRGLATYDGGDRGLFFGRDRDISAILERLRSDSFVLVAGDSGVGKSSLCRAGVLPRVGDGALAGERLAFDVVTLVPGRRPLAALAVALASLLGRDEAELTATLRDEPGAVGRALRLRARGTVLFLDQLEELLTLAHADEARAAAASLAELLLPSPKVRVLATVRSDFLGRLAALPALGVEVPRALQLVVPLDRDAVREAIVGPAARTGVRFDTTALVERLVEAAQRDDGGLPLLSFALAELWLRREGQVIRQRALDDLGGVAAALARHADGIVGALPPVERAAARRLLTSLVTGEGTRSRRSEAELVPTGDAAARVALEALVSGRLVTARASDEAGEGAYEIAHEALIDGWETLRDWLTHDAEERAARQRLERGAKDWERLGRPRESLLWGRALAEAETLDLSRAAERDRAFVAASRAQVRRARWRRLFLWAATPAAVGVALSLAWAQQRMTLQARVRARLEQADATLAAGRARNREVETLRQRAFADYEAGEWPRADESWTQVLTGAREVDEQLGRGAGEIEAALALEPGNASVRGRFADVLLERLLLAERDHREQEAAELGRRLPFYDDGTRAARLHAPARITVRTRPAEASVTVWRYDKRGGDRVRTLVGPLPAGDGVIALPAGSYRLDARAAGRAPAVLPLLVGRGEARTVELSLPAAKAVPDGYVYVPAGAFLFGSYEADLVRREFNTTPERVVTTGAYLIAQHEVTWGDWIAWLRTLPPGERDRRRPVAQARGASVELRLGADGRYVLALRPTVDTYVVSEAERLRYPARQVNADQDWLRMPVSGVSVADIEAYAAWLDASGRVPGARLCNDVEWERAARGADDRLYPSGDAVAPADANRDATYGREVHSFGPDEVGRHPGSRSPFGVDDMTGNVWEWVRSSARSGELIYRGGSWYQGPLSSRASNRERGEPTFRHPFYGARLCARAPVVE